MLEINRFKLKTGCLASFMLFSTAAFATDTIPLNLLAGWNSITQTELRKDLDYLTADQREGRLAASKGDEQSIEWIVEQFKQAGLKPANGNSYLQTFNVVKFTPDKKQNYVQLDRNGNKTTWKKPAIVTEFNQDIDINAEIVFAGYGITAPDLNYDDYANIDVHNKLVLVFEHEPQETNKKSIFNGTGNTPYATNRIKALNAQAHGALGILIAPEPTRKHPSNQERYEKIGGSVNRKDPIASMVLENDVLKIPVAILSDKVAKQIAGKVKLAQIQKDIDVDLKPRSQLLPDITISLHEHVTERSNVTTSNVVGLLEGYDDQLKNETILISAHHDHDGMSGKQIWHGADDNGSGTIGVVAIARAMAANTNQDAGLKPKRSILFSVFAAEERGLLGAYYMAAYPLRPLNTTRAMINFDMIGRDEKPSTQTDGLINIPANTHNRLNLIGAHFSPEYANTVIAENKYVGLTLDDRFDNENALNIFFRSDQFPFVLQHVPALWWFTGFHPDYHHTSDTAEKINYEKMQKILRLGYLSAYAFANMAKTPEFITHPHA